MFEMKTKCSGCKKGCDVTIDQIAFATKLVKNISRDEQAKAYKKLSKQGRRCLRAFIKKANALTIIGG